MPILSDWRSSTEIDALQQLERPGFAWEFLRRNRKYRADYGRIIGAGRNDKREVAKAAAKFARYWGLICTDRPKTSSNRGDGTMAPGNRANRCHFDACADRLRRRRHRSTQRFWPRASLDRTARTVSIFASLETISFGWLINILISRWPLFIPLDDDLPLRAAGVLRLHRLITANKDCSAPQPQALSAQKRNRLIQMLLALDGRLSQGNLSRDRISSFRAQRDKRKRMEDPSNSRQDNSAGQ